MSREQGLGVDREGPRVRERREPVEEDFAVRVVGKERAPVEASHHHVVKHSGRRFRTKGGRASRRAWRDIAGGALLSGQHGAYQRYSTESTTHYSAGQADFHKSQKIRDASMGPV